MKMKSMMASVAFLAFFAFSLSSCQTKQHAVSQLEKFSEELRVNGEYYDVQDWNDAAKRFQKIRHNISKHDYSAAERKEIGKLEGQCAGYFVSGVKKKITGIGGELKGMLEGILNSVSDLF